MLNLLDKLYICNINFYDYFYGIIDIICYKFLEIYIDNFICIGWLKCWDYKVNLCVIYIFNKFFKFVKFIFKIRI